MPRDPGDDDGSVDSFLREIARAPSQELAEQPERIGRFRVTGRLGRGGMGIVYRGEDEALRRTVAVKVLPPMAQDDEARRKRLLREARAVAAFTHANVAAVYEIGVSDGRVFFAMEYVEGKTLRELLEQGPLAVTRALEVALQMASGLAKAHRANVVHRDLKPENVMVDADGVVKILDFGLAKLLAPDAPEGAAETATLDGHFRGTPAYASPEQARGKDVGPATDVFAFGVTLYEMLTGKRPFEGASIAELAVAMDHGAPPRPSATSPEVPSALDAIVMRALAKDAGARFADGDALVAALAPLVSHAVADTAVPAPASVPAHRARGGWLRGAAFVGLAAIAAFAGLRAHERDAARTAGGASASAAASSAPSATIVRMGDGSPPVSTSSAAVNAYRLGMKEIRDASLMHGFAMLHQAVELDPQLAAAHLRLCIDANEVPACRQALTLRDALGARDREMLRIAEASATRQEDGLRAGLAAARARFPEDEEIAFRVAQHDAAADGGTDEGLRALSTPQAPFAYADWVRASRTRRSDPASARAAAEQCVAWTPGAASCLAQLQGLASMEGRCDEMLVLARRRATLDPESPKSYFEIAWGLEATGAAEELYVDALERAFALGKEPELGWIRARMHAARGNFAEAERWLPKVQRGVNAKYQDELTAVAAVRMRVREELGDEAGAGRIAVELLRRRAALRDVPDDPFALALLAEGAHRRGGLSAKEAVDLAMPLPGALRSPAERTALSALLRAVVAEDAAARPAALGWFETDQSDSDATTFLRARLRQAAGDLDGAAADFTASGRVCSPEVTYLVGGRAELLLGALEASRKDSPRACAAYGRVLARWGKAVPRSATAEEARAKRKALGCAVGW